MAEKKESAGQMTREKMMEYYDSFNKGGGEEAFYTYYTEDCVFKTPWGREISGLKNAIAYINDVAHRKGKIKETLKPSTIVIEGDVAAVELISELEALEDVPDFHMGGSFKKGDKVTWTLAGFYKVKNGKFAVVQLYVIVDPWLRKWMS
jgi:ketosteroid isomerase-like protein